MDLVQRPKMNCTVGFVNCFLRVPLAYQPCCPVPCCSGKQGELSENCLPNLTVQFIIIGLDQLY